MKVFLKVILSVVVVFCIFAFFGWMDSIDLSMGRDIPQVRTVRTVQALIIVAVVLFLIWRKTGKGNNKDKEKDKTENKVEPNNN